MVYLKSVYCYAAVKYKEFTIKLKEYMVYIMMLASTGTIWHDKGKTVCVYGGGGVGVLGMQC